MRNHLLNALIAIALLVSAQVQAKPDNLSADQTFHRAQCVGDVALC